MALKIRLFKLVVIDNIPLGYYRIFFIFNYNGAHRVDFRKYVCIRYCIYIYYIVIVIENLETYAAVPNRK